MGELLNAGPEISYKERVERLLSAKLAVWDVLQCAVRPGSLDANIDTETARANDFKGFFQEHSQIELVCFNGQKAAALFERLVVRNGNSWIDRLSLVTLPSTSPAHASMSFAEKLSQWSVVRTGVRSV